MGQVMVCKGARASDEIVGQVISTQVRAPS
jgi:hypothetical protein